MARGQARGFDGPALRRHREARRLGRADLADLVGVSPSTIAKWESGAQSPDPCSAARVRSLLRLERHDLIVLGEHEIGLADVRMMAGFTAQRAAAAAGTGRAALAEVEAGRRTLDPSLAESLGRLYGVDQARLRELWRRDRERRRNRLRTELGWTAETAVGV